MFDLERSILIPHTYHPLPVVWRGEVTGLDCSVTPIVCEANGLFFPGYETEDYQQIAALNAANERKTAVQTAVRFTREMCC